MNISIKKRVQINIEISVSHNFLLVYGQVTLKASVPTWSLKLSSDDPAQYWDE